MKEKRFATLGRQFNCIILSWQQVHDYGSVALNQKNLVSEEKDFLLIVSCIPSFRWSFDDELLWDILAAPAPASIRELLNRKCKPTCCNSVTNEASRGLREADRFVLLQNSKDWNYFVGIRYV